MSEIKSPPIDNTLSTLESEKKPEPQSKRLPPENSEVSTSKSLEQTQASKAAPKVRDQFSVGENEEESTSTNIPLPSASTVSVEGETEITRMAPPAELLVPLDAAWQEVMNNAESYYPAATRETWQGVSKRFAAVDPRLPALGGAVSSNPVSNTGTYRTVDASKVELFASNVGGGDLLQTIDQGNLNDCYFLASLAAVAAMSDGPNRLKNMIRDLGNNQYEVTFYTPQNTRKTYTISSDLLMTGSNPLGAKLTDADHDGIPEIGINLLEKAFALYSQDYDTDKAGKSGYATLDTGYPTFAIHALLGVNTSWATDAQGSLQGLSNAELYTWLNAANQGSPVVAGTGTSVAEGLFAAHAYTVLGAFTDQNTGKVYVTLRNPYGHNGQKEPPTSTTGAPTDKQNDGIFNMTLEQFKATFSSIMGKQPSSTPSASNQPSSGKSALIYTLQQMMNSGQVTSNSMTNVVKPEVLQAIFAVGQYVSNVSTDTSSSLSAVSPDGIDPNLRNQLGVILKQREYLDPVALVQYILAETYIQNTEDLRMYAEKTRFFNNVKKAIRSEMNNMKDILAKTTNKSDAATIDANLIPPGGLYEQNIHSDVASLTDATQPLIERRKSDTNQDIQITTYAGLKSYIDRLDSQLQTVGDDAQMATLSLQNMLQKQQQTLQQMSNISKQVFDTIMAIIRKIS